MNNARGPLQILIAAAVITAGGCGIVGPSCLSQQKTGTVTNVGGEVAAGAIAVHQVPYGTEGSQNDVKITWSGQFSPGGPRIRVYATRLECGNFTPETGTGDCAVVGHWVGTQVGPSNEVVHTGYQITNGRGNPVVLGSATEYKLWIVGDERSKVGYTISITWFRGPDC